MSRALGARVQEELFSGYMRLRRGVADFEDQGGAIEAQESLVLSGPGHDVAIVAALMLDAAGTPHGVLKGGDTRPARTGRGEPYVKIGLIGGRLDHQGVDAAATAVMELSEETGAELLEGTLLSLSKQPSPTMPTVSSEADHYYLAVVHFPPGSGPRGDGSGMELSGLLRPVRLTAAELIAAIDRGAVGEGARARVAFTRALAAIGYLPLVGRALGSLPEALQRRFDPLGLPAPLDPRQLAKGPLGLPDFAIGTAATVDRWALVSERVVLDEAGFVFRDAQAAHQTAAGPLIGAPYRVQYLSVPYDLAKVVRYAPDPVHGALVGIGELRSVPLAVKAWALAGEWSGPPPKGVRRDLDELAVPLLGLRTRAEIHAAVDRAVAASAFGAPPFRLGASADASPGQSDLRYHFYATEVSPGPELVPLAEAIRAMRNGDGDAATETTLYRLADHLGFIPELGLHAAALPRG